MTGVQTCALPIYRDAIWDNERLGSLVIIVELGDGNISDVTFENIEIYYDYGRAINATIIRTDSAPNKVSDVSFKNVSFRAAMKSQIKTRTPGTNSIEITFHNVLSDGYLLTQSNYAADVILSGSNSRLLFVE